MNQREIFRIRNNNSNIIKKNLIPYSPESNQNKKNPFFYNKPEYKENYDDYLNQIMEGTRKNKNKNNNYSFLNKNEEKKNLLETDYNLLMGNNYNLGINAYEPQIYHRGNNDFFSNRDILSDFNEELFSKRFSLRFPKKKKLDEKRNNFKKEKNKNKKKENGNIKEKQINDCNKENIEKKNNFDLNQILTLKLIDPDFDIVI